MKLKVFISSVQKEFQQIRKDLKAFLLGDAVLHRFISEVFLFEELPAKDHRADQVYLDQVKRCDIYVGIFGYEYGNEDKDGVSLLPSASTTTPVGSGSHGSFTSGASMRNDGPTR